MAEVQKTTEAGEMTQVFIEFVMMHAQNAALFLGQIPNPRGQEVEVNLPLAKMFIDQLAVLREKTRGNLSKDEQEVIDSAVGQLQGAFVEVAQYLKSQNLGLEVPEPLATGLATPAAAGLEPELPRIQPVEPVQPEPVPAPIVAEPREEEGRKRFSKSYGA